MVEQKLGFVLLFVENPQQSGVFYQELLGLAPVQNSPTFVMFMLKNGVALGLWSRHTAEPAVSLIGGGSEICFPADDVDAVYNTWQQKGIPIIQKPTDMDFGRTFVAVDPDGHRIRVYRLNEGTSKQPYRQ